MNEVIENMYNDNGFFGENQINPQLRPINVIW